MNRASEITIGEVCNFVGGSQPAKSYFSSEKLEGYIRLIQIRDYKTDSYITYIPKDSTKKFCSKDDIMIGRYGPPIFQILRGLEGAYNVALMKAVPKDNINNDYLYYYLRQEHLFEYINALSPRTGGQTGVDVMMLKKYPILLPDIKEQKQIAKVLSDLDAKIEVNNKINSELEAMAKTIYDYWFVQFDFPDANGKPYKSSGGKMVYIEELKREIPEGWEVKELKDIADIKRGKLVTAKTANLNGKYKVVSAGIDYSYLHDKTNRDKYTITVSGSGANAGFINFWREPIFANDCSTVRGKNDLETFVILQFLKLRQEYILNQARGSAQPHVYPKDLETLKVLIPNIGLFEKYGKLVLPFNEQIAIREQENQKLAELRDWLLPMLMNGQVTVMEAYNHIDNHLGMVAEEGEKYNKS
jgi:type I restriction enzyme, S subunit